MSGEINYNFTPRECVRSLNSIGFVNKSKRGKHFKFYPPERVKNKIPPGRPQFIMIPNHRNFWIQHKIIRELLEMGGDELVNDFVKNL